MAVRVLDAVHSAAWAIDEEPLAKLIEIASRDHEPTPQALEAYKAQSLAKAERATRRDGVAIVSVEGPLFKRANLMTELSGATSYDVLRRDLQAAVDDLGVRAVLLNMDSPGGEAAGCAELAAAVAGFRGQGKPIVAYVGDNACSAAYWIASAADSIVIGPTASVGSIGVRATYSDTSSRDERSGVRKFDFVSSQSPYKKTDLTTDEGRGRVQARVDALAQVFVETVAANRGVSVDAVLSSFGQGDVLIGAAAVAAGMADEIGTFETTLAKLARGEAGSRHRGPGAVASKPLPPPAPVRPVVPPTPPAVLADRARIQAIIALAGPAGADAEAREAIRTGMGVEAFRGVMAATAIINARRAARGR